MTILIIRFSSLGDVVLTAGVVESVSRRYPEASLTFLTKSQYVPIYDADSRIGTVVGISGHESPREILALLGTNSYDVVIDLHANLRSLLLTSFLSSPRKLRVRKHALARRIMIWSRNRIRRRFDTLGQYRAALRPLGISERFLPEIVPDPSSVKEAGEILKDVREHQDAKVIGIAPGAKHATKRWNEHSFALLADALIGTGHQVVFLGDSNDVEIVGRVQDMMARPARSFAGTFDLRGTIGLISQLDCLVCNDSGPMHMAGALGTPFAALFGPTHPDLGFCPGYMAGRIIHTDIPCSPCSIHGATPCRLVNRACMDDITPEMVLEAITGLLAGTSRPQD